MSDIVERLRDGKKWLNDGKCCGDVDSDGVCAAPACLFGEALGAFYEAADTIEALRAENALLLEALKPFADEAAGLTDEDDDCT